MYNTKIRFDVKYSVIQVPGGGHVFDASCDAKTDIVSDESVATILEVINKADNDFAAFTFEYLKFYIGGGKKPFESAIYQDIPLCDDGGCYLNLETKDGKATSFFIRKARGCADFIGSS